MDAGLERRRRTALADEGAGLLALALDAAGIGLWHVDLLTGAVSWDARVKALFGLPPEARVTRELYWSLVHPEDLPRVREAHAAGVDPHRRIAFDIEYRTVGADGRLRWIADKGQAVFEGERCLRWLGVCLDLTAQKAAQARMAQSEEQLRLATEAAEIGLWDLDVGADRLFWPPRVKAMFGISPDQPISMEDFWAGLHRDDRAWVGEAFDAALDPQRRSLYDVEYRTIGKEDGAVRWVAAKGRGIFENDRCTRVIGVALDVTRRKADEARLVELNESLERRVAETLAERKVLADVFEAIDACVMVVDLEYRVLAINTAAVEELARAYGVRPVPGDSFLALLAAFPQDRERARALVGRALLGESFTETHEFGERRRRTYRISLSPLDDRDGRRIGAVEFVEDVTEQTLAQERLALAERNLMQAQKIEALGQLTGGVAHDFNNLLMVILGGIGLIETREDPAVRAEILARMRQAVERGGALSRQLLTFARRQPLKPQSVDLADRLAGMRALLDRALRADVQVETDLPADLWPVEVDPGELELALLNLCVNARDALPQGGRILLQARNAPGAGEEAGPDMVRLLVADTGVGMTAEVLAKVFEPYFTTKPMGKGSGLGLAQVYGFARQSGGRVAIESAPGEGARVTLWLPRSFEAPTNREAPAVQSTQVRRGEILVVEDDPEVAALVEQMCRSLGYGVVWAGGGQAALGALADGRAVDLVFSDVMMPGAMNGVELAREVRRRRPALPVVLTTGRVDSAAAGADELGLTVLAKPYDLPALSQALSQALAGVGGE